MAKHAAALRAYEQDYAGWAEELLKRDVYETARFDAENETGLMLDTFPEICEWTVAEVLGKE